MNILVACEESQRVTVALRERGHYAYSCDILECSGGHPEWHIQQDVLSLLDGNCSFITQDSKAHYLNGKWDMIIAFPPCTYLTNAGTRHFSLRCNPPEKVKKRKLLRKQGAEFFMRFVNADCERIAIENPVGFMNSHYRKADQIVHPYYFAINEQDVENYHKKRTCLWLKGLPKLQRASDLPAPPPVYICQGEKCKGKGIGWCEAMKFIKGGQAERAKARSKTFYGIAKAMASQWTPDLRNIDVDFTKIRILELNFKEE